MKIWNLLWRERCSKCGQKLVPVVYGFPGPKLIEEAERGKVVLGGCVVQPGGPKGACPSCDEEG